MQAINIIFPHQLFLNSPLLENNNEIYLIEEFLFFKQYKFHKQKIAFHRASMKAYQNYLQGLNLTVHYIDSYNVLSDIRQFHQEIKTKNIQTVVLQQGNNQNLLMLESNGDLDTMKIAMKANHQNTAIRNFKRQR